jgi:hypothetical protein
MSDDCRTSLSLKMSTMTIPPGSGMSSNNIVSDELDVPDAITAEHPLRVVVAGAGIGGLALANDLCKKAKEEGLPIQVTVLEQTSEFRRFGGPIQLASNALEAMKTIDKDVYANIMEKFTFTGDKTNGIKDGKRTEWYAKFDLASPAERRNMPYTGVIDRSDLQQIQLNALPSGTVRTGDKVVEYEKVKSKDERSRLVKVRTKSGKEMYADVLIGADGIWSEVRATMRGSAARGEESGATYSGYTVYAGELHYDSPDHGEVGYKVYIGPNQVRVDILQFQKRILGNLTCVASFKSTLLSRILAKVDTNGMPSWLDLLTLPRRNRNRMVHLPTCKASSMGGPRRFTVFFESPKRRKLSSVICMIDLLLYSNRGRMVM